MPSHVIDMVMLRNIFGTAEMRSFWSDENRLQKQLDVEAALALAEGELGLIPTDAAKVIASKAKVEFLDLDEIAEEVLKVKHSLMPTVKGLQKVCGQAGEYVHYGVTTQDVVDTGMILQLKESHSVIVNQLQSIVEELSRIARKHRGTPMAGRSHGMQGMPTTFGFKIAVILSEVIRHLDRLREIEEKTFIGVLGGAVGTYASFGSLGPEVERRALKQLGLEAPEICWHSSRDRIAEYIGVLGMISATIGKMANEFYNLMRTEIDEIEEPFTPGKIGSSTMPHKRNPAALEGIVSLAKPIRYNVALILEGMIIEHERDAMSWRGEWIALPETCIYLSAQLASMHSVLQGLVVKPANMLRNLNIQGGVLLSERIMFALAGPLGKQTAHNVVYNLCVQAVDQNKPFREMLLENQQVCDALSQDELETLLDPSTYLGEAPMIVDRVLERAEESGWLKNEKHV
ncbi:3-carboxy-cis,cis-muconate cycloisomerase [Scopulibacillus darangshiensis]|uniref:3-carboxy-cis,cis-muconate cycloisomerase n=1 Tax=Scopulibacillus darangshiensis TaxID=442528 RepID=A0A4R2NPL9_9BACL|nr:adenylosuccinate lyase [Scopulibacillus darangshiensis]TCP23769.1 3-carboxy-cis,cis-muconate cycloisomerase [Scopulibacillus darangshiensis]